MTIVAFDMDYSFRLDTLMEGFKSGNTYELCGLSGSGKTQICSALTANTAMKERCVHYIDTKGGFSATKIQQIISRKDPSKKVNNVVHHSYFEFFNQSDLCFRISSHV